MAAPELQLFISPGSCATAAYALLIESGLPFSTKIINVFEGFPVDALHLNPKGRVPILHLNGEIITEMPTIMMAIAQLVPDRKFLGDTNMETIRCYEWFSFLSGELHALGYYPVFRPHYFVDDKATCDELRKKGLEKVGKYYGMIEDKLEGLHAVGDGFTAADVYLLPFYRWGIAWGFAMKENYPKYTALIEKLVQRESVKKACEIDGMEPLSPDLLKLPQLLVK
ncbi:hypothetical protein J4E80_006587 [Alternaria sp. BMP 0032]|nr:hypothetical protein J4E80_006587 [Alternaria sp. BMP 0032]